MIRNKRLVYGVISLLLTIGLVVITLFYLMPGCCFLQPSYIPILRYSFIILASIFFVLGIVLAVGSTLSKETVLNNYNRARIFTTIEQNPGIHFNELLKLLHLGRGQTQWHLTCLQNFDMIKVHEEKNFKTFYPNYGMLFENIDTSQLTSLKSKTRNAIYQEVCNNPSVTQSALQELLQISQSTIAYHLIVLEQDDLISVQIKGRKRFYFPTDEKVVD